MKLYIKIFLILNCLINCFATCAFAARYPKSKGELRREAMGSITDAESINFRPFRAQNDETASSIAPKVNKYLWQAALSVLKTAPLASIDSNSGIIITDWYSPKGKPNCNFKINVFIKGEIICPESLEVRVFEQKTINGGKSASKDNSNLSAILEEKILQEARSIYINSNKKNDK